ncbi:MAG: FN3 domain-containing metallophosphoesterase family protein, partial [Eubacteriales bacterium]|nr:FN3 domain-containing metallophosphoesterase family protein [Eubacteriales bacterium]
MKKRLLLTAALSLALLSAGCGGSSTDAPGAVDISAPQDGGTAQEEELPETENWGSAPDYKSTLITTTSIRYLSVTAGASADQIQMTWFSPSETAGQVFLTSPDDTEFADATLFDASVSPSEEISGYYINRATVTGLTPGTEYLYRVGGGEDLSPAYTYTAPEDSDSFRFTAVGDPQLGKPADRLDTQKNTWHKVLNKIHYHFPDTSLLVSLGDQVNDYDDTEQYNAFLNQGVLYNLALAPVKGNHDAGNHAYSEHFTLPNQSSLGVCDDEGDGDYWFVRGNALFLVLDVIDSSRWAEHAEFIAAACEANPDARWRIVFSHYSPYNSYESYLENAQNLRPYYLDFTSAYDIDLVMCGHDHSYMRSHFIQADGSYLEYESPAVDPEGTMYLTLSSSSGSLYHNPTAQNEAAVAKKVKAPQVTDV